MSTLTEVASRIYRTIGGGHCEAEYLDSQMGPIGDYHERAIQTEIDTALAAAGWTRGEFLDMFEQRTSAKTARFYWEGYV